MVRYTVKYKKTRLSRFFCSNEMEPEDLYYFLRSQGFVADIIPFFKITKRIV